MAGLGGAASAGIAGMLGPAGGYSSTFVLGGLGTAVGNTVNGNTNTFAEFGENFVVGGLINMGGKFVGDKVADGVNKAAEIRHVSRMTGNASNGMTSYLHSSIMSQVASTSLSRLVNYSKGYYISPLLYNLISDAVSLLLTGWY
jgi:hypothetical protein